MNNPTATIEELKATLDAWIPKYIRQVVELRSGNKLTAERYNELMNLLITQGDDTIELAQVVKQYVELLVDGLSNNFVDTTDALTQAFNTTTANVTAIAEGAVGTAEGAVASVTQYKAIMDTNMEQFESTVNTAVNNMASDINAFKTSITESFNATDTKSDNAVATANQLVADMEGYRVDLSAQVEQTFRTMRDSLSAQITSEVAVEAQEIQELLTANLNTAFNNLSAEVTAIADSAVQIANSAVEDVVAYKESMDARLEEALKEVEDSLTAAEDVIKSAAEIYDKIDEIDAAVKSFEGRVEAVENSVESIKDGTTPVVKAAEADNAKTLDGHGAEYFATKESVEVLGHKFTLVSSVEDMNTVPVYTAGIVYAGAKNVPQEMVISGEYAIFFTIGFADYQQIQRLYLAEGRVIERIYTSGAWQEYKQIATTADLANYLPLNGGKLSTSASSPLKLESTTTDSTNIAFDGASGTLGHIGFVGANTPAVWNSDSVTWYKLLHTGNYLGYTPNGKVVTFTTPATAGWYRIAVTKGRITSNPVRLMISGHRGGGVDGYFSSVSLEASICDGKTSAAFLNILSGVHHKQTVSGVTTKYAAFTKVRQVRPQTISSDADYSAIDIYQPDAVATTYTVELLGDKWTTIDTATISPALPSNYSGNDYVFESGQVQIGSNNGYSTGGGGNNSFTRISNTGISMYNSSGYATELTASKFVLPSICTFNTSSAQFFRNVTINGNPVTTVETGTFSLTGAVNKDTGEAVTISGYNYTKIGKLVFVDGIVPTGGVTIAKSKYLTGLPFTPKGPLAYLYIGTRTSTADMVLGTSNIVNQIGSQGIYTGAELTTGIGSPISIFGFYFTE